MVVDHQGNKVARSDKSDEKSREQVKSEIQSKNLVKQMAKSKNYQNIALDSASNNGQHEKAGKFKEVDLFDTVSSKVLHGFSEKQNMVKLEKEDLKKIREELLKAVDVGKVTMKSFEEKETKLRPTWYDTLDLPTWIHDRPALSWDFPKEELSITAAIAGIPPSSQENILIDDLLYIFEGLPGTHIVPQQLKDPYEPRTFTVSEDIDQSLRQIVLQILPLASHYSVVRRFIEKTELWSGQVIHALVAAIETFMKDYYIMIAQLETEHLSGQMTLQKLRYYVLPTMRTLEVIAGIVTVIGKGESRGGGVLSILHEKTNALLGDSRSQEICLFLTEKASQPYMQILHQWIHRGNINDPFQEFLVEDNEIINKEDLPLDYSADYWEKRYTIQRDRVPKFLDKLADIILRTGKYLNVISQCGKPIQFANAEIIKYSLREQNYGMAIQKAYSFASKSLLELLLKEYDLMGRLKSVKHYFLMDQGDFIVQFMDSTEQELTKNIDDIIPSKLESLLGLCLRLSAACHDPYNEDMRVELLPYDLQLQMFKILSIQTDEENDYKHHKERLPLTGIEAFSFGMEVKWPVSLILNHKAIACYQMIFRHLFYCKHVERLLCRVWLCNKVAKKFEEGRLYASAFALRQRMLGCLQNLQYYMCIEVLEPSWSALIQSLNKVNNVDEVLERHSDFQESCLGDCMLTSPQLLRAVTSLCSVCVKFCAFIQSTPCGGANTEPCGESFSRSVARYDLQFTAALLLMLAVVGQLARGNNTSKLLNLMARLNFNTFYTEQVEVVCAEKGITDVAKSTPSA